MKNTGIILAGLLLCHSASADITLTMSQQADGADSDGVMTLSIAGGKVKMQDSSGNSAAIFDSAAGTFTHVDHDSKSYMTIDKAQAEAATSKLSEAMKQMEAQMAQLPEAQRRMIMEQMKSRMPGMSGESGGAEKDDIALEWTDQSREIAGYKCKVATMTDSDGTATTLCIAKRNAVGMSDEDFETMAAMFDTLRSMAGPFARDMKMANLRDIDGVPIATSGMKKASELIRVNQDSIAASEFAVPADYAKRAMPAM